MNRELPAAVRREISVVSAEAQAIERQDVAAAVARWRDAVDLLPGDATQWRAYSALWSTIGDALYTGGDNDAAAQAFQVALRGTDCDEAYLRFMLAKASVQLGDLDRATDELRTVYAIDGSDMFDDDHEGTAMWSLLEPSLLLAA